MTIFLLRIVLSLIAVSGPQTSSGQKPRFMEPTQSLQLVQEIETPVNAPSHLWYWVTSMAVSEDGRSLVLFDMKVPRITILDFKTLRLDASWGKEGKGPGEFGKHHGWVGIRGDTVYVSQVHRTSLFLRDGKYLGNDILTLNRKGGVFDVHLANGVDKDGLVYFLDGRQSSSYLVGKKTPKGTEKYFIDKNSLGLESRSKDMKFAFGVLSDGSVILTSSHEPFVARYSPSGSLRWKINLVAEIEYLRKSYDQVRAGKYQLPFSNFWVDEEYTIITFSNTESAVGKPSVYYVFLNSQDGSIARVAYAAQNIIRTPETDKEEIYEHHLYSPWAIAHHRGTLFAFSYNSSRLQKYKLTWYQ